MPTWSKRRMSVMHCIFPCRRECAELARNNRKLASDTLNRASSRGRGHSQDAKSSRMSAAVSAPFAAAPPSITCVEQVALALLERHHLLLDRVDGDQPVDHDRLVLADPVGAVDRLRLDRRVPPRVEHEDVVGLGQVEPEAAGLQADQEHRAVAVLELRRSARPGRGCARPGSSSRSPRRRAAARTSPRKPVNWLNTNARWPSAAISASCSTRASILLDRTSGVLVVDQARRRG